MKTDDNLQKCFAMMAMAAIRCSAYGNIAEKDGYHQIARMFRASFDAYKVHALNALKAMGELGSTAENLFGAVDSSTYDFTQLYPIFLEQSDQDGNPPATALFRGNLTSLKSHANLLKSASANINRFKENEYWVCQNCGYIEVGDMPLSCKLCGGPREKFALIA